MKRILMVSETIGGGDNSRVTYYTLLPDVRAAERPVAA